MANDGKRIAFGAHATPGDVREEGADAPER